ncbi:endonuclease MutS2 [Terrisporobacter mayombei]|uniref:Endonuclease MutS2 n=1 Tax=Terrisporobacter mayombei TaxID=1541 RepID=A0ABY9Q1C5_9FIRM|nr:endonuclease MutS2 [Terrisporobacter mayombei]MCC3867448.1 endonuclease MutS2 [Terrisporobacter mayombei]WMT81707.1 Endonuclease MutS2 [Terrisporobacter mayombei]
MNLDTFEKLQLNEVKELVKVYCVSSLGKSIIDKLEPSGNYSVVKKKLEENKEARRVLESSNHVPLEGLFNIYPVIDKVEKGIILDVAELISCEDFLRGCRKIKSFMLDKEFYSPTLSSYALNITECENIEEEIKFSIKNNKIYSEASKELKKIRRSIDICEGRIKEKLNKFLTSSTNKKYIQEFIISKRDDRFVVPIKSSFKNEVDGTILDTSSKGSTVFIEPASISKYSLELITLKSEESIEEYKILSYLTELIYYKIREIKLNMEIVSQYDMVFAKAKFSQNNKCITPNINNNGYSKIVKGKHPLLKSNVVPLDFEIGNKYRSLIITGPNAGGKTITLKTVGILTLMTQCGFDIPAMKDTEISVFEKVFVDIGDNQSIENSLSTFSSHIKNISDIMREANKNTLILFDEIGSGTDPNEGASLAIALLEEFYQMGCIMIASTHYEEIKHFANKHPHFKNAGMMFNKETLEPLYKLVIGKSEDSNALFISKKMGIKDKVLQKAKTYMDNKNYDFTLVKENKIVNKVVEKENSVLIDFPNFEMGDKVELLDFNDFGIVYKPIDKFNNVEVLYKYEFININARRLKLQFKAKDLYPEGYDLNSLFISFEKRKLDRDIERGSKKALKKIKKEIKSNS